MASTMISQSINLHRKSNYKSNEDDTVLFVQNKRKLIRLRMKVGRTLPFFTCLPVFF
jgi:hypothetical protein